MFGDGEFCHHAFWIRKKFKKCAKNIHGFEGWDKSVPETSLVLRGRLKVAPFLTGFGGWGKKWPRSLLDLEGWGKKWPGNIPGF